MNRRNVYEEQAGAAASAGGSPAAAAGVAAPAAAAANTAFADAATARSFLGDFVHEAEFLKSVPDDKVVPWATKVKGKVDSFGNQFPEKWRSLIAGDNAEHLKTLERFATPKAMYESYTALRGKMASGELKAVTAYPDKGTDAEKADWRKQNGIPEKPDEYKFAMPQGVELDDDDKAVITSLQKASFDSNMPPANAQAFVNWFLKEKDSRTLARVKADNDYRASTEDALRAEWGQEYRGHVARIDMFLASAPKGVKEVFAQARTPDGNPLGNHPEVLKWLLDQAIQANPAGVMLPAGGGNIGTSISDEITKIEKFMRDDRNAYNKDEKAQARLRDLYAARDRLGSKKAA